MVKCKLHKTAPIDLSKMTFLVATAVATNDAGNDPQIIPYTGNEKTTVLLFAQMTSNVAIVPRNAGPHKTKKNQNGVNEMYSYKYVAMQNENDTEKINLVNILLPRLYVFFDDVIISINW